MNHPPSSGKKGERYRGIVRSTRCDTADVATPSYTNTKDNPSFETQFFNYINTTDNTQEVFHFKICTMMYTITTVLKIYYAQ